MQTKALRNLAATVAAIGWLGGCAGGPSFGPVGASGGAASGLGLGAMDQERLEEIFAESVDAIAGPAGALQTRIDGVTVYCISDAESDRMRFLAPVTRFETLDPRIQEVLLRANFHVTLDARYAISEDVIFATYLHPISTLTAGQIRTGLAQVVSLVKTFGTTFSSGDLLDPDSSEPESAPPGALGPGEGAPF